jgi:tetraacyldisaccharide 4'-kinase
MFGRFTQAERHRMSGPLPRVLFPITTPLAWGYERIIRARNARYDRGVGVKRVDVPVISVGNITMGGTGKTPMVAWIAERLISHGRRPAIAMRGYGATADQAGDEQLEYAERLPNVPLIVNPDRVQAIRAALAARPDFDCVILDDGFQHRRLHHDLNIVLVDATRDLEADRLLPAGHLREPLDSLRRADAVVVTRAARVNSSLASMIERHHGKPPLAWARHQWQSLMVFLSDGLSVPGLPNIDEAESTCEASGLTLHHASADWLRGKRVLTMLGVGNPDAVIAQIESHGATVVANVPARDHESYTPAKLRVAHGLCGGVDAMMVTLKDWVKIRTLLARAVSRSSQPMWPVPIIVPQLAIEVFAGADQLESLVLEALSS